MLSFEEKILILERKLNCIDDNYADSFKTDILFFIDNFDNSNPYLKFLHSIQTENDINEWVNKLTSRLVMKENELEVNEIIFDYIELG